MYNKYSSCLSFLCRKTLAGKQKRDTGRQITSRGGFFIISLLFFLKWEGDEHDTHIIVSLEGISRRLLQRNRDHLLVSQSLLKVLFVPAKKMHLCLLCLSLWLTEYLSLFLDVSFPGKGSGRESSEWTTRRGLLRDSKRDKEWETHSVSCSVNCDGTRFLSMFRHMTWCPLTIQS